MSVRPLPPAPGAEWLTREETAGYLRLSVAALTSLRGDPTFPSARRVLGSLRWSRAAVDAWMSRQPEDRWDRSRGRRPGAAVAA